MLRSTALAWVASAILLADSSLAHAELPLAELGGNKGTPFVAPGRLFAVLVPASWGVVLHKDDPYAIEFRAATPDADAGLLVKRVVVPPGANPRQLLLNAIEQRLTKLPLFKLLSKRDVVVAGLQGAAVVATYAFQGNIQYPRAVEEVFIVSGTEAFIFHFECVEPFAAGLANDLNRLYGSFLLRPPGQSDNPYASSAPGLELQLPEIPF